MFQVSDAKFYSNLKQLEFLFKMFSFCIAKKCYFHNLWSKFQISKLKDCWTHFWTHTRLVSFFAKEKMLLRCFKSVHFRFVLANFDFDSFVKHFCTLCRLYIYIKRNVFKSVSFLCKEKTMNSSRMY